MRTDRAGLTLVELLIAVVISGILTTIAITTVGSNLAKQGARNARDEFAYMAARARAAAVERSRNVRLEVDPSTSTVRIVTGRSGAGDTIEVRRYAADHNTTVTTEGDQEITVCYSPRGYADSSCSSFDTGERFVDFTRGGRSVRAMVRPLGQVIRQ